MTWNLIHKYLSGQCSKAELKKINQWLREDAEHRKFINAMEKIWEVEPGGQDSVDVEAAWRQFRLANINTPGLRKAAGTKKAAQLNEHRSVSNLKWYQKPTAYAAAAALLLIAAVLFVVQMQVNQSVKVSFQDVITQKGEKTSLKLTDGTRVMLNAASVLKIPSNYGRDDRTVYLQGEAFFEVMHDKSRPFRVYSGDYYTEDLGTKFNIRTFAEDSILEVVVAEGEVETGKTQTESRVHLQENERALVSADRDIVKQRITNLSSYIGWTQGKLVFIDTPLEEVIEKLERWYDVACSVQNKNLLDRRLTATFENEPLSNVLQLIARSMDIETSIEKRTVTFSNPPKFKLRSDPKDL